MITFDLLHSDNCEHCKNMINMLDELKDIYDFDYNKIEIDSPDGTSKLLEHGIKSVPVLLLNNTIVLTGSLDDEIDLMNVLIPHLDTLENNENGNGNISEI